jgi:hypothetical protein
MGNYLPLKLSTPLRVLKEGLTNSFVDSYVFGFMIYLNHMMSKTFKKA